MLTNERLLLVILVSLILGASVYFVASKFKQDVTPNASPSPTPNLNFVLNLSSPSPQPNQPSSQQQLTNPQTGPLNAPQTSELPLARNKKLDKFPGLLSETELTNKAVTLVTSKGNIIMQIFADAPRAASNFLLLSSNGFYDNLTFHRVEPGFLIQGGDPKGDGTGGAGYSFEDEPITREYDKGTVAMANSGPNTNSSQFFIVMADHPNIPKQYTIFGKVIFGMDVVERMAPKDIIYKAVVQPLQ